MTGKTSKPADPVGAAFADDIKDSAQQIWLAGLGAFAKAQEHGGKVFEKLVKDGTELQRGALPATIAEMAELATRFGARATASAPWDRLENLFEQRVARAMANLGAPTASDLAALQARVAELEQAARREASPARATRKPAPATASKAAAPKAAASKSATAKAPRTGRKG